MANSSNVTLQQVYNIRLSVQTFNTGNSQTAVFEIIGR